MSEEIEKKETTQIKRRGRPRKNIEEVKEKEVSKINKKENKKKVEENKLIVKKNSEELSINNEKLEKIEEEIRKQKTISEEKSKKINKKIFINVIIAITIILYFIFINLGYSNIELEKYLVDLKVFSIITISITIILFEKAYKKDSAEITIFGIETLVLSIITLLTNYYCIKYTSKYPYIINSVAILFGLYYIVKSTVIYIKMKRKALYTSGDIHKIVKK